MTEFKETELDERAIKMAKVLSADAVERAGHGHPGSPVSLAPIAYTLYQHFIKHDPNDPKWEGRDRFILSGGHASLTQYVQLYFSGYGLTLDDLKNFRGGADTRTPGHPEYGLTPGIEMTTGPLGQGFASAIGFAYGQRFERGLLDHLHANSTVLDTIAATGDLTSETEEALKNAVEEFHHQWISAGRGAAGLEDGEVVAERTREEISRGRTNEKA